MQENEVKFYSLKEAAQYARVERQAIFNAIRTNKLKAQKTEFAGKNGKLKNGWVLTKQDIDDYRAHKYSREKRIVEGEKLFDIENGKYSIIHVSKILTYFLKYTYTTAAVYYLVRTGKLRASKKAGAWVIFKDALIELLNDESGKELQKIEIG